MLRMPILVAAAFLLALVVQPAQAGPIIADSVADFPAPDNVSGLGKQGTNGWTYGYHDFTNNGVYGLGDFIAFPDNVGPGTSAGDFWTGTQWDWQPGNPPWSEIGQTNVHPNGTNSATGGEQWVIRRYTVQPGDFVGTSDLQVTWDTDEVNLGGTGVTGLMFHNGTAVDSLTLAGGQTTATARSFRLMNVQVGDVIDLALAPGGASGGTFDRGDGSDGSSNSLILNIADPLQVGDVVADARADYSGVQGGRNWFYGLYNRTADGNGVYDANADFTLMLGGADQPGTWGDNQHWDGADWDFNPVGGSTGNPPWTVHNVNGMHPNDTSPGPEHYAVRRYVVDIEGEFDLDGFFNNASAAGDGTNGIIYLNGVQIFSALTDGTTANFNLTLDLKPGDILDFLVDTGSIGGTADGSDFTNFQATLTVVSLPVPEPAAATLALMGLVSLGLRRRRA